MNIRQASLLIVFLFSCKSSHKGFFSNTSHQNSLGHIYRAETLNEADYLPGDCNLNAVPQIGVDSKIALKSYDKAKTPIRTQAKLPKINKIFAEGPLTNVATKGKVNERKKIVPEKRLSLFPFILMAIFFPPVAVGLKKGFNSKPFFLTVLLTALLYIPGMVYAIIKVLRRKERDTIKILNNS